MDTEEEEPHHAPNVESSLRLEDNLVTKATTSELLHGNTEESQQFEVEYVAELNESGPPAPSAVAEKEKEDNDKGVVDVEVVPEAAVGDGGDLIVGEEKQEMLDAGDEMKASSPVDGDKEGDREENHVADEEDKADVVEDAAVDGVMEEIEKADVSNERGTAGGMELAEEAGKSEDQIEMPVEKELADVAEERGMAEAAEVDDVIEQTVEETGIMEEREVADVAVKREMLEDKQEDDEVEQTGILVETGVGNMAEKSELLEEKPVVDVAERIGILEETVVIDRVDKSEILEEKLVVNVSEQTQNLEDGDAVRETSTDMTEVAKDTVMEEESEKAEDTELGNVVEDVEKVDRTETEMGDAAEGMEAAEDAEMLDMTEEVETDAAEEMEDTEEVEEASKASGGKRKRGKNLNSKVLVRATSRKKVEEDVCFICFDGGDLVLCDRRGCPKAYHPACVGRDEAFFRAKGKWNCGWHLCSNCKKNAYYMCYTCTFSLCKGCIKDAVILCVKGNKGLCESCMNLIMLIERNEQAQIDFDDKSSWEYLFKDYWIDLKRRLSITSDELAQAKNPWKGSEDRAAKQESPNELYGFNDCGGSDSDSPSGNAEVTVSKRRKTRSQSKSRVREGDAPSTLTGIGEGASTDENAEWASKELLDVVMHMRNGDKSVLSRMELSQLILDYIQKHKLRDRRNKSYVICDSRLKNLFGKPRVGHIEMLNLLDPHIFFTKEDPQTDDLQGSVVDAEANQLEADWNTDALTKTGKDKKRRTRKKGDARGLQSNLDDYAAIDMHNINLIYLRRNLMEDLLEDTETFHDKVVGSFVRIRISGAGQKQDLYRLVQVVGTNKVAEPYRVGKRTTDFLLEILNLNKTEVISIDIISNQEFTEDECKRLRQSIKCGLINRLTVGDIQEKALTIQAVRVKDWLESEIMRLSHLRDRASEKGRRKELRECVEKLQLLKTPEERQRRLEEIPEIHVDPNMDPSYESEDDEGEDDKKQDNYMRPRGSGFSRRGREPISPRKGGFSSSDSWSATRNYSSMNRELSRTLSNKGFTSKGDDSIGASETGNDNLWNLGRERETQQPNSWDKPKTALNSEIGTRNTHSVVIQEPSSKVVSEIPPTPLSTGATAVVQINETEKIWHYRDPSGKIQGPFSMVQLRKWSNTGYFPAELKIWRTNEKQDDSILLTDALAGKFQKDPPVADNSFPKAKMALFANAFGATLKQGMEIQVGERPRFDQNQVAWSPQRTLGSSGQSAGEIWKPQAEVSSSAVRPAPSSVEIPKYSRDTWGSDTNLPSPTPNQNPTGGTKGQAFESKWSPTPVQSSGSISVSNPFQGGTAGMQPPTVVSESGSPAAPVVHSHMVSGESHRTQANAQASINSSTDMKNAGVSLQNLVPSMSSHNPSVEIHGWSSGSVSRQEGVGASSIPAAGTQAWGNTSAQKVEPNPSLAMPVQPVAYGHWGDASQSGQNSAPFSTGNPIGVFPTPGQPAMLASDSWRPTVPVQSNVQLPAPPNLPWGMAATDNQGSALRQAPGNQNTGWGPMPGNQNMGWGAPVPANTNVNWGASSQGSASVNPNPSWAAPVQGQVPGNANPGWTAPGNAMQGWAPPGQGPAIVNPSSGWVAPGSANPGYVAPSGNSGMWGSEQNQNGDKFSNQRDRGSQSQGGDSGFGGAKPWSRQSSFGSGGGSSRSPFKGQRVCKFHENGHCKKGASCDYMHT